VTISVGVANYPDHAAHSDELIAVADAAMYRAKNAGKTASGAPAVSPTS
jgi:diguanylate cyclase (GGDEF)-like protein